MRAIGTSGIREWILRTSSGQELTFRLEPGQSVTLGRDLTSDVPILDAGVSRHHATILLEKCVCEKGVPEQGLLEKGALQAPVSEKTRPESEPEDGEELWLEDLHSHNGTFVNAEPVHRERIRPGDIITLGRVPLTLLAHQGSEEPTDPLHRLSPDKLALLVRVARGFAAESERSMIFHRLLELAMEALRGERGAVLLWEEERAVFHPVAAAPQDLFRDVSNLLNRRTEESILRGGKARLLWQETTGGVTRMDFGHSSSLSTASGIAAPLLAGTKPMGILYLDRLPGRKSFQQSEADFLFALTWAVSSALNTSCHLSDMREWNQRLESMVSQRAIEIEENGAKGRLSKIHEGAAKLLSGLQMFLAEARQDLREKAEALSAKEIQGLADRTLRVARVCVEAVERLCDRQSARLEEIQVAHAVREVTARLAEVASCNIDEGGDLSVFCAPDELLLVMRLAIESISLAAGGASAARPERVLPLAASAFSSSDGSTVRVRLCPSEDVLQDALATPRSGGREQLPILLARRIAGERLRGEIQVDPHGPAVEICLPQAALSMSETVAYPGSRFSMEALKPSSS
jgi:hypothetical protein